MAEVVIQNCANKLEKALAQDRDIVHELQRHGLITPDVHDEVLETKSLLSPLEKSGKLVCSIRYKVQVNDKNLDKLLTIFKSTPQKYEDIIQILETEIEKTNYADQQHMGYAKPFKIPLPLLDTSNQSDAELKKDTNKMIIGFSRICRGLAKFIQHTSTNTCIETLKWLLKDYISCETIKVTDCHRGITSDTIQNENDVSKLMNYVTSFSSFFNFKLVEDLIDQINYEEGRRLLEQYKKKFEEYLNGRVTKCPPGIAGEKEGCVRFMVQLDDSFKECRMTHLLTLKDDICEILNIKSKDLVLDGIESGSIWIVYYLLEAVVPFVFPLKKEQVTSLSKLQYQDSKLFTIKCGGYYIEIRKLDDELDEQAKRELSVYENLPDYIEGCRKSLKMSKISHSVTDSKVYNKAFKRKIGTFKDMLNCNPQEKDNCGETALHWAVLTGKIEILKYLLEDCHCNITLVNEYKQTVLHLAASEGNSDMVQYLVKFYHPVLSIDSYELSPLHYAILSGNLKIIEFILKEYNVLVTQLLQQYRFFSSTYNLTAFHISIAKGNKEIIKYFMAESGEYLPYDLTSLILAVPHRDICVKLHENFRSSEHRGYALLAAIYGCHMHSIKHLLNIENLDLDFSDRLGRKVIHYAAMSGDPDILHYIILVCVNHFSEKNIPKNSTEFLFLSSLLLQATDNCNKTPLDYAALYGKYKMVKCIINQYGFDPSIQRTGVEPPVHAACRNGHLNIVRYLIEECNCNPNIKDSRQHSPLDIASNNGHIEIFKYLVEIHNCDVKSRDSNGVSSLFYAVCNGHISIIQYMMAKNYYNPSQRCDENDKIVLGAIKNGKLKLLIQNDFCNPKIIMKNKFTLLHATVVAGYLDDVEYLVEKCSCDLSAEDEMGITPVDYAATLNHFSMLKYFVAQKGFGNHVDSIIISSIALGHVHILQYLIETNNFTANQHIKCSGFLEKHCGISGFTPVHLACARGHIDIIKYLVDDCQGKPDMKDYNSNSAIHYAIQYGQLNVLKYLVESLHCDPYQDVDSIENAFSLAISMGHCHVVEYLVQIRTSEFNTVDIDRLLACAAQHGQLPILMYFIKEIPFSYTLSYNGVNPINAAIMHGHLQIVQYLIENCKFDPNVKDLQASQVSPIFAACLSGHLIILKYLILERSCTFSDEQLKSLALFCAIHKGHLSIVQYLLENCDYKESVVDELNRTPLEYAAARGHLSIVNYLVQHQPPKNNNVFLYAIKGDYLPIVKNLIEQCSITSEDHLTDYILYFAIQHGRAEIVKYLLKTNIYDSKLSFSNGLNIIQTASYLGHLNIVKLYLEKYSCDPHYNHNNHGTPLYLAAMAGQLETVEYLLEQNFSDPNNGGKYGGTLLHPVCSHGWLNIAHRLIYEYNCDPNSIDNEGWPPLYYTIKNGHLSTLKFLIHDQKVNPSTILIHGITALHAASKHGHIHIVKFLTEECKCSLSAADNFNKTPLYYAAANGHIEIVKYFINYPMQDINAGMPYDGNLLMVACYHGHLDLVKYLITECSFDPQAKNSVGDTSLHTATYSKQLETLQYLIEKCNCDPNLKGQHGRSLIHCASLNNDMNMSKYLVEICKIDPMVRDIFDCTPLHYTTQAGHVDLVKYFIASGVSPSARNQMGNTPLHQAASYGNIDVVRYLVEEEIVNPIIFNNQGFTPLKVAENREKHEVVSYLSAIPSVSPNLPPIVQSSSVTEVQQNNMQTESSDQKETKYVSEMGAIKRVSVSPNYEKLFQQVLMKSGIGRKLQLILKLTEERYSRKLRFIPQINFNSLSIF